MALGMGVLNWLNCKVEMMTKSDYIMTCPGCDTDVMVEDVPDAPDVSCGCQKGHGPMMDVLKVVGRNE